MPGPQRKPPENLRRRNAPELWVVLPDGCKLPAPPWPLGKPAASEAALWRRLWALPVAAWWHEQRIDPFVIARYVRVGLDQPQHAALGRLESDLGLTPAGMAKLRLVVERPEVPKLKSNRYGHILAKED